MASSIPVVSPSATGDANSAAGAIVTGPLSELFVDNTIVNSDHNVVHEDEVITIDVTESEQLLDPVAPVI